MRQKMATTTTVAEKALQTQTSKIFAGATKRYKKFMRQAAKSASNHKREQYLAAALGALVVTGLVASELKARMEKSKTAAPAVKKSKKKAKL
jgi:hypothetical protein